MPSKEQGRQGLRGGVLSDCGLRAIDTTSEDLSNCPLTQPRNPKSREWSRVSFSNFVFHLGQVYHVGARDGARLTASAVRTMSDPSVSAGHSVCSVKVFTRVRPISKNEREHEEAHGGKSTDHGIDPDPAQNQIKTFSSTAAPHTYKLDGVLADCTQHDIYCTIANDFMADVVDGYNATIFAYGQTGAGKSLRLSTSPPEPTCFVCR